MIFRGLPVNLKQTNLKEWLSPIRLKAAVLFRSQEETFAFVTFNRATDMKKALLRTDQFLGGYKVNFITLKPNNPFRYKFASFLIRRRQKVMRKVIKSMMISIQRSKRRNLKLEFWILAVYFCEICLICVLSEI